MHNPEIPEILACTGGIGSGKTFVATIFEHMGVPVYYSDDKAKELYTKDIDLVNSLIKLLGTDIVIESEPCYVCGGVNIPKIDLKKIALKIFGNDSLREELEKLVHPAVLRDFENWRRQFACRASYVIIESAIIMEKPLFKSMDKKIMVVVAPEELRIDRVIKRDKTSKDKVLARISSQWSDARRIEIADFVIFADEKQPLLDQIIKVDRQMKENCVNNNK